MPTTAVNGHDVAIDIIGSLEKPMVRITCVTCTITMVRQSNISIKDWDVKRKEFLATHPCFKPRNLGYRA